MSFIPDASNTEAAHPAEIAPKPINYLHRAQWFTMISLSLFLIGFFHPLSMEDIFGDGNVSRFSFAFSPVFSYLAVRNSAQASAAGKRYKFFITLLILSLIPILVLAGLSSWIGVALVKDSSGWLSLIVQMWLLSIAPVVLVANGIGFGISSVLRRRDNVKEPRGIAISLFRILGVLYTIMAVIGVVLNFMWLSHAR